MSRKKGCRSASATWRFVEALEVRRLLAAVLVKDINPQNADAANLTPGVELNGTLYFTWLRADIGLELWKTDGTADGTVLVKDINPGTAHGYIGPSVAYHGQVFFIAATPGTGRELWKTDGTEAGTQLVKDLVPGTSDLTLRTFVVINDTLLFAAFGANTGLEWFITDGTATGTHILKDLNPGAFSGILSETGGAPSGAPLASVFNGAVYFSGTDGTGAFKLWKTDGTEAGTVIANPSGPTLSSTTYPWQASFNGALYYTVNTQLWRIDPSGATIPITTGDNQTLRVSRPVAAGEHLYFTGTGTDNVARLYQTDGQPETTALSPGAPIAPTLMTSAAGQLFFVASDAEHGSELWVTDGTNTHVIDINPGTAGSSPTSLFEFNGALYFRASDGSSGTELWRSDGSTTSLVKDINPGVASGATSSSFRLGTRIWFAANDGTHGNELWSSDGTAGGTALVKDLDPTSLSSNPSASYPYGCCQTEGQPYPLGFFNATINGTSRFWRSDGTAQGTFMLTGLESYALTTGFYALPFGNGILFAGNDPIHGSQLWASDGTQAGTRLIKNIGPSSLPDSLTNIGGRLWFSASTPATGRELWVSDGTEAGTHLAVDLTPGTADGLDDFAQFVEFHGSIYFDGWLNGTHGLLRSGGTPETTELVIELIGGTNRVYFRDLTVVGDQLLFTVDGKLYSTDGTDYTLVKAISPYYYGLHYSVVLGNTLLFTADDGNSTQLWRSDGTVGGTYKLTNVQNNYFSHLTLLGNSAYVLSATPTGALWKTDGTLAGTVQVKTFPLNSILGSDLPSANGRLYFVVANQLWQSDGTAAGTIGLQPFRAPFAPGNSLVSMNVNGALLFNGWEPQTGVELWKIAPPVANAGSGYSVAAGAMLALNGGGSSDPDPAESLQYSWDLDDDGTFGETGPAASRGDEIGPTPNFFAPDLPPGTFAVRLRVTDSIGLDSVSTGQITISPPPFMDLSPDAVINWSGSAGNRVITLHSGSLTLNADLSSVYPGISIVADNAATVHLPAVQHLKSLTLSDAATLDLMDSPLFISAPQPQETLATIRELIKSAKIFSSTAQSDSRLGIGYAFDTTSNAVKIMPTRLGDLNLDATVSISDFIDLSSHFGQSTANWSDGDLNYDDQISIADFITLASNFGQAYSPPAPQPQPAAAMTVTAPQPKRLLKHRPHHRRHAAHFPLTDRNYSASQSFRR